PPSPLDRGAPGGLAGDSTGRMCQMLGQAALPVDLEAGLDRDVSGPPGWVDALQERCRWAVPGDGRLGCHRETDRLVEAQTTERVGDLMPASVRRGRHFARLHPDWDREVGLGPDARRVLGGNERLEGERAAVERCRRTLRGIPG